jgi:cell division septation protein DedD
MMRKVEAGCGSRGTVRRCGLGAVMALVATMGFAQAAQAEVGMDEAAEAAAQRMRNESRFPSGERYDVTITPPLRPGSEPVASLSPGRALGLDAGRGAPAAAPEGDAGEDTRAARHSIEGGWTTTPSAPTAGAAAPKSEPKDSAASATGPATTTVDRHKVLQVGAYRRYRSATDLQDKLLKSFDDVFVSEANSGGEPLYRVRVGTGTSAASLDELKSKLVASGYSCFPVTGGSRR